MGMKNTSKTLQIIFYCTIVFILYLGVNTNGKATEATDSEPFAELAKIVEVMDKQGIEMTNWTLYTREYLNSWETLAAYQDELLLIQNKTTDFTWEPELISDQLGQTKTSAIRESTELGITEKLTYIVYSHNEQFQSYLIYEVLGEKFSGDIKQSFAPIILSRLEDLSLTKTNFFTRTTGNGSDKRNFSLEQQSEKILAEFSARKIEFLKEETFISVSAYTNIWNDTIKTNDEKMNLQVAIRENLRLGGKTTVTIGTPIITTEY
jgi:hypothetical protein